MTTISPSILSCDFMNIATEMNTLNSIEGIWIHLDIMDGHFVPNLTFGIPIVKQLSQIAEKPLDAHLMVTNPEFHIEEMKDFGLHNITFHFEAQSNEQTLDIIKKAKLSYPSVGISIKPKTAVEELSDDILKACDLILVMSVEPGFGGQSFMPNCIQKIESLAAKRKELKTSFIIQVDGGINNTTAKQVLQAGADNLVAGSFIFKEDDYQAQVDSLLK